jgi:hypothetical protein
MENALSQLRTLVRLAIVDRNFDKTEEMYILTIGKARNIPEQEIRDIIEEELHRKEKAEASDFSALSFDGKFEYLYNIIQLMKIDQQVYLSEIRFCEKTAEKLGFEKKVVKKMSSFIYSDPSITVDRDKLKQKVRKFIH